MNRKKIYFGINFIILLIATWFMAGRCLEPGKVIFVWNYRTILILMLFGISLILVHLSKMIRLYLVLLEQKIPIWRFIRVYVKTTYVNMLLPFKSGEIFRIYCFSHETKQIPVGIMSILVDRFFDTCALLIFLIPCEWIASGQISSITALLSIAVFILIFLYRMFEPTYTYLNRYFILHRSGKRTLRFLHMLEATKGAYDYCKNLIEGRYALILLFSCLGWLMEFGALWCIAAVLGERFGFTGFATYIRSIFGGEPNQLLYAYACISGIILAVTTVLFYIQAMFKRRLAK